MRVKERLSGDKREKAARKKALVQPKEDLFNIWAVGELPVGGMQAGAMTL